MRQGTVYRRCTRCGARVEGKRCTACGGEGYAWAYRVDVSAEGGRRRQRRGGGFKTKAEALHALAALQSAIEAGTAIERTRLGTGQYLDQWLDGLDVRATTATSYRLAVRKLAPLVGSAPLQRLDRQAVRAAYETLATTPDGHGRIPAPKTVHNVHLALVAALNTAMADGLVTKNAASGAHRAPRDDQRPEMRTWTPAQVGRFLATAKGDDEGPFFRLLAMTGCRRGEALGLRWEDLDLDRDTMAVRQQLTRVRVDGRDVWGLRAPKTRSGRRTVDLDAGTVAALRAHRARQAEHRLAFGPAYSGDLVFARGDGSHLDPDWVGAVFQRLVIAAGLPRIRLHDLRHSHASALLTAGTPVHVVAARLGHASPSVTLTVYAHVLPGSAADAIAKLAAVVDGL